MYGLEGCTRIPSPFIPSPPHKQLVREVIDSKDTLPSHTHTHTHSLSLSLFLSLSLSPLPLSFFSLTSLLAIHHLSLSPLLHIPSQALPYYPSVHNKVIYPPPTVYHSRCPVESSKPTETHVLNINSSSCSSVYIQHLLPVLKD